MEDARKVALVLNGDPPGGAELALLVGCDAVVCADGGAAALLRVGRVPDWIVGDLDSLDPRMASFAASRGARVERLPPAKDETDGERALERVLAMKPREVLILGGHGHRSAMVAANLFLLRRCAEAGVQARMVGHGEVLRFLPAGATARLDAAPGALVNVLPVEGPAVVSLRGLVWSRERLRLEPHQARGVSNTVRSGPAEVEVHEGTALVVVEAAPRDAARGWLRPDDGPEVVYEFFAPFAHVPGKYEWCRIRSPTHGVFDCFILLTTRPVTVYVASDAGARFLAERYPEVAAHRVPEGDLSLHEAPGGRAVEGRLRAREGPVRAVDLRIAARDPGALPRAEPYGGEGKPVWGSARFTCWGVDLNLDAAAEGAIAWADGREEALRGVPALLTLGSFGRIAPLR